MKDPNVLIVMPVFNRVKETLRCLKSLHMMHYPEFLIYVVDCGSTDGVREAIIRQYPQVKMIEADADTWWPDGINIGIRYAQERGYDCVMMMNQDSVVDPEMLSYLVKRLQSSLNAIAGPKVYYLQNPKMIFTAGGLMEWWGRGPRNLGIGRLDRGQYDQVLDVDWLGGAGTLVRTADFQRVGLLDAKRFRWASDLDFSYRAKLAGLRVLMEHRAIIWHEVGDYDVRTRETKFRFLEMMKRFFNPRANENLSREWLIYQLYAPKPWFPFLFGVRVSIMIMVQLREYFRGVLCKKQSNFMAS